MDKALHAADESLKRDPKLAEGYVVRGSAFFSQGRLDDAVAAYRRAIEVRADYPQLHAELAELYDRKGLAYEAEQERSVYRLKELSFELYRTFDLK